jgi:hypothetical protein
MSVVIQSRFFRAARAFAIASVITATASAGPPLICHPFDIGVAKSLPGGPDWHGVSRNYDRTNLTRDTLSLLTPVTPILVRMETLRRAAIYATAAMRAWNRGSYSPEDRAIAMDLFDRLHERARAATGPERALALFDAGYFSATLRETRLIDQSDGYDLLVQADKLRGGDAEIQFALALASQSRRTELKQNEHLRRARDGAAAGSLLAANLVSHFEGR